MLPYQSSFLFVVGVFLREQQVDHLCVKLIFSAFAVFSALPVFPSAPLPGRGIWCRSLYMSS